MNDVINNARGWWDVFFGDRTPVTIPQPAKQKTLEDFGWVKGSDNVYRQPTPSPIPTQVNNYEDFQRIAKPIFDKYQIPYPVGFGQFGGEGRLSGLGAKRKNYYNISAYDSNPGAAQSYETPAQGIEAYAKLLSGKYELGNIGSGKFDTRYLPAYELRSDPVKMLQKLFELGYASRSDYPQFIQSTPEWKQYYNGGG